MRGCSEINSWNITASLRKLRTVDLDITLLRLSIDGHIVYDLATTLFGTFSLVRIRFDTYVLTMHFLARLYLFDGPRTCLILYLYLPLSCGVTGCAALSRFGISF